MPPRTVDSLSSANTPVGGVYLFSEGDKHYYAGRTQQTIAKRVKGHVSGAKDCPLAFRLARQNTQNTQPAYSGEKVRSKLLKDSAFSSAYQQAKDHIKRMDVRFVQESDPIRQALLEIYVAVVLGTEHNEFDTH